MSIESVMVLFMSLWGSAGSVIVVMVSGIVYVFMGVCDSGDGIRYRLCLYGVLRGL